VSLFRVGQLLGGENVGDGLGGEVELGLLQHLQPKTMLY